MESSESEFDFGGQPCYNRVIDKEQRKELTVAVDYVAGKKNSLKTKKDKALWHEQQVAEHTLKAANLKEEMKEDEKLISNIENLLSQKKTLEKEIASLKLRIAQPVGGGLSVDQIFEKIEGYQKEIDDIGVKVRSLYYGK